MYKKINLTLLMYYLFFSESVNCQIINFKLISNFHYKDNINYKQSHPIMSNISNNTYNFILWDNLTRSYIYQKNNKIEFIRFQNGRGSEELQVNDFFICKKNHLLIYDPSISKLLIYNVNTAKSIEFEIEGSYNRILSLNTLNESSTISFYIYSTMSGEYLYYNYSTELHKLNLLDVGKESETIIKEVSSNPFSMVNNILVLNKDTLVFVNYYEPIYFLYDINNQKLEKKYIYKYTKNKLKKYGLITYSPEAIFKSATLDDKYLYCIYYNNKYNNKGEETIVRINFKSNKVNEIKYIDIIEAFINGSNEYPTFITKNKSIIKIIKSVD